MTVAAAAGKKKINRKHLALLVGVCLVILALTGGILWGVHAWLDGKHQEDLHQKVSQQLEQVRTERNEIEAAVLPEGIEQEKFDVLKASALAALPDEMLETLSAQKRLSDEEVESALAQQGSETDRQALYFMENLSAYPGEWLEYYERDTDRFEFVKAYPQREDYQTPPAALDESLQDVPHLLQWDLRWGYEPYGDSLVCYAGCAPTCLSMVFSYLNQDPSITPAVLKSWSESHDYYVSGVGTSHALLSDAAGQYGIDVETIPVDQQSISQALAQGKKLIFNMVPGTFTQVGHFIVVSGEQDGMLTVRDPNSIARSQRTWSYDEVLPETAVVWAYSKSA